MPQQRISHQLTFRGCLFWLWPWACVVTLSLLEDMSLWMLCLCCAGFSLRTDATHIAGSSCENYRPSATVAGSICQSLLSEDAQELFARDAWFWMASARLLAQLEQEAMEQHSLAPCPTLLGLPAFF